MLWSMPRIRKQLRPTRKNGSCTNLKVDSSISGVFGQDSELIGAVKKKGINTFAQIVSSIWKRAAKLRIQIQVRAHTYSTQPFYCYVTVHSYHDHKGLNIVSFNANDVASAFASLWFYSWLQGQLGQTLLLLLLSQKHTAENHKLGSWF